MYVKMIGVGVMHVLNLVLDTKNLTHTYVKRDLLFKYILICAPICILSVSF